MRETNFIQQNKNKWQEFERILDGQRHDPDKLSELFVQVTDDLSYSRTFYPNRSVRVYLNSLAQRVFFRIYRTRRSPLNRIISFWTEELPRLIYESRREFRLSFRVFVFSFFIGALSSAMDPDFASIILGDDYVSMTEENIESGDPMKVYKQRGEFGMSLGITANNLFIAFLTFVMGVAFGIGSLAIIARNAVMVGVFQHFFIERDLFRESFLTIWVHGTLEISAIIIAGAAGLTMGKGLAFPGTYTRMQSFQQSARRGIKIMTGIAPVIILAGFIEGYLTRYTETPDLVRALFILACLAFVLFYFVWYPPFYARHLYQREKEAGTGVMPVVAGAIDFERIKSAGEVFADVFAMFQKHAGKVAVSAAILAAAYTAAVFRLSHAPPVEIFSFPNHQFGTMSVISQFFVNDRIPWLPVVNFAVYAVLTVAVNALVIREQRPQLAYSGPEYAILGLKASAGLALMQTLLWTRAWYTFPMVLFFFPAPMLLNFVVMKENTNLWTGIRRTLFLISGNYGRVLGLFFTLALVGLLFFSMLDSLVLWTFLDLISWIIQLEESMMNQLSVIILSFLTMFFLYLIVAMLLTGTGLLYFSLLEIQQADALRARVRQIGSGKLLRGMEQEG